jgi:hypothetical protein
MAGLRAVLLDMLPLTPPTAALNRVWVSSWDVALADPGLGRAQAERYERLRATIRAQLGAARATGDLGQCADQVGPDLDRIAATVLSFAHGLVVQALFDPEKFGPEQQTELLDAFLAGLR